MKAHAWYSQQDHRWTIERPPMFLARLSERGERFESLPRTIAVVTIKGREVPATCITTDRDIGQYLWPDTVYLGEFDYKTQCMVPAGSVPFYNHED